MTKHYFTLLFLLAGFLIKAQNHDHDSVIVYVPFTIEANNEKINGGQKKFPELIIEGILFRSNLVAKNFDVLPKEPNSKNANAEKADYSYAKELRPYLLKQQYPYLLEGTIYNYDNYTEFRVTLTDIHSNTQYYFDVNESRISEIYTLIDKLSQQIQAKIKELQTKEKKQTIAFHCFTSLDQNTGNTEKHFDSFFPVKYIYEHVEFAATSGFSAIPFSNSERYCKSSLGLKELCDSLHCDFIYSGTRITSEKTNTILSPFVYKRSTNDTFYLTPVAGITADVADQQDEMTREFSSFITITKELMFNDSLLLKIKKYSKKELVKEIDTLIRKEKYDLGFYLTSKLTGDYKNTGTLIKGRIRYHQKKFTEATEYYEAYLEQSQSKNKTELLELYICYLGISRYRNAVVVAKILVKEFPDDKNNYYLLGKAQYYNDSASAAISSLQKSIDLGNTKAEVYYSLGKAYIKTNDFNNAELNLKKAVALDSVKKLYPSALASLYATKTDSIFKKVSLKDSASMKKYIDLIYKYDPSDMRMPSMVGQLIILRYRERAYDMAMEYYLRDTVKHISIFFDAASWCRSIKNPDGTYDSLALVDAIRYLNKDLSVSAKSFQNLKLLGSTYYRLSNYKQAVKYYDQARIYNKNDVINMVNIAEVSILDHNPQAALNVLDDALKSVDKDENLTENKEGARLLISFYIIAAKSQKDEDVKTTVDELDKLLKNPNTKKFLGSWWSFRAFKHKVDSWEANNTSKAVILNQLDKLM